MIARPAHALTNRMTSLILVVLLHGLLLLLLLNAFTQKNMRAMSPRETILRLLPLLQRVPQDEGPPSAGTARNARPLPAPIMPPSIATTPAPDVTGLGMRLFGCAPEQLATLTPEERARCATGLKAPDPTVVTIPKSHVQDPARRAAEMKAKNSPPRIPCTYVGVAPAPHGTAVAGMIDPFCAMDGLFNGYAPLTGLPK